MADPSSGDQAAQADPRPPEGYRLLRTLGHGGDGWVALAVQESVGRQVAVKTLYALDPAAAARLRREGQALSRLSSDRIVRVYDLLEDAGRWSLILEYVNGVSLAERLLRPPALTVRQRLSVLRDVAEALTCAHRAQVVHRDVKPANVLLDGRGRAKLSDFGIARLTGSAAAYRTVDGTRSGTRRYAAPEQWADPLAESPAMDAFSFAVLAYELLVGQVPDEGLPDPLPGHLPPAQSAGFRAATADDPANRPAPGVLVRLLAEAPEGSWTPPDLLAPAAAADATSRDAAEPAVSQLTLTVTREPLTSGSPPGWADPPVFRPGRSGRLRPPALLVGLFTGLLVAVLVVAFGT
ncbi:MAG: eukaryotic-like serine/threonine-protein kinase [Frankiales bacterium]|jgi:serine/threonine-protein kinase|nr:eukaryotic-like serine/threonine-protein kinase [Frankiales bacterium]